jgi:PKD repeat protein
MNTTPGLATITLLLAVSNLYAATLYVSPASTNPTRPYTNWVTAATNIQDAVDAAQAGDTVLVTNGLYNVGQRNVGNGSPSRVAITNAIALLSVNGPQFTVIDGGGTNRCAYLINGASLTGLTLMNGNSDGYDGAGVWCASQSAFLTNCVLCGNSTYHGGGAFGCTLYNCTLTGNSATGGYGGGAYNCTLYNCTLTGNSGGGAYESTLYNCIVYFNPEANYDTSSTLNYCCTTPLPTNGIGNIALDPQLASATYLSADSPCRGAGSAAYATGTDIDGEPWGNPPSIGCEEYRPGAMTGPLVVGWLADRRAVTPGYPVAFTGLIEGRTTASAWEFGDGDAATNQPYVIHGWTQAGDYRVVLRAFNESNPEGVSATGMVRVAVQPVLYVATASTNPQPPYTSWDTAATNIQIAVDTTVAGAEILVTNGVYAGGVVVTNPLTLRSVNGPQFTLINGAQANRCASLTNGASLTGFTLTNGFVHLNEGGGVFCVSTNAFLTNCVIAGNLAYDAIGAGAFGCTLYNCTLTGNSGDETSGGGAVGSTLYNCTLIGNSAGGGGGAERCTLYNCTLTGNSAYYGGGASLSTLYNCTLTGNSAPGGYGGGAYDSTLYNCTLTGNSAAADEWGDLGYGGGTSGCVLYNCIAYFNTALGGANYDASSTLNYCCTTPLPPGGAGNIALDPHLASASHLSANSPCRGAGSAAYATGMDIDGEQWGNPPSIGCDEYHAGAVIGPLRVSLLANYTNVAMDYSVSLTALIEGRTTESVWDFGGGDVAINEPFVTHSWAQPGDYLVALWAFNDSLEGGVSAAVSIHVAAQRVYYVAATGTHPQPPYSSWATAATNIQDAVDATTVPGAVVLVTNGVYAGGLAVNMPLALRSLNGPQFTVINGGGTNHCASLTDGASLTGFTLTNGVDNTSDFGGVHCASPNAFLTNCVIVGNYADMGGGAGGGTLYNCTLTGNSARYGGGGASICALYNCIVYFNTANYDSYCTLNYCCTTPLPANGVRNITSDPLFVDYTHGNLRLQSNSPCINAGNNAYVTTTTDLDGYPRIVNGTVDIGAYEYQGTGSVISYAWLQQYGLPTDGSADYADPDHDGLNDWQEWICGTIPTNALSALRMLSATPTSTNTTVKWQSVAEVNYFLERSADLAAPFTLLATNIVGQAGTTSCADTNGAGAGPFFYRVGVKSP